MAPRSRIGMLRAQFRQYPATAAANVAGPRSCAAAAALPQAVIPSAQQPRSAARRQAGSLAPRHPTLGSAWTPHQAPRSITRPRSRRRLAAHPDDRRHANAPQPAGRPTRPRRCTRLKIMPPLRHCRKPTTIARSATARRRSPSPSAMPLETSRPPTCRNLRHARSGCSYARGHALRHQPAETGRARTPRLPLHPPSPPPFPQVSHRRQANEAKSACGPLRPSSAGTGAARPRARRGSGQAGGRAGRDGMFWLEYEFRTTHCSMLTR